MIKLLILGLSVSALSMTAFLDGGADGCSKSSESCTREKTSLVLADAPAGACVETKVAKTCDAAVASNATSTVKADGACCGEGAGKTTLVSLEPGEASAAPKALDAIKPLAGKWRGETEMGTAEIDFKVGSGGSAVVETMFPGTAHEMTNVYVMDGDNLLVTHYCAAGNAPRMKLTKNEAGVMTFEFHDATNLADKSKEYMGGLVLTLVGPDQLTEKWISYVDGKESSTMEMKLERVK